jgi:clan AA aspartic protease
MISGNVVGLQARVGVALRVPGQPEIEIEFVIDTGYEGDLTLPPAAVAALNLPVSRVLFANLADDSNALVSVHVATILWNGVERDVEVLALGWRPLLGTALLEDHNLNADFVDGGSVALQPLSHR